LCGIVERSASWNVVERTDLTVTILNGRQFEIGQCMVLPLRHAATLLDLTEREDAAVMAAAKRLTRALVTAYVPDGVLLYQNNGVGSGQEVPHFHLHVVPRRPGSDWGFRPPHIARLENQIGQPISITLLSLNKRFRLSRSSGAASTDELPGAGSNMQNC
jgi:diadenosine tetraphosphate (Ap4A) HIT family hydrolase